MNLSALFDVPVVQMLMNVPTNVWFIGSLVVLFSLGGHVLYQLISSIYRGD